MYITMFCGNCGAELTAQTNFCPYCGNPLRSGTVSISLLNKAASTARDTNEYSLVLVSRGTCDPTMAGDLLEDVFGYTDAESTSLVRMVPVVVGENLTSREAATVAQLFTEYGLEVSITDRHDQYVDLTGHATSSIFDSNGALLAGAAAIIGALTVANRISAYRTYRRPSLMERLFRLGYQPAPPVYHRNFRPHLVPGPVPPRRTIRKPLPPRSPAPRHVPTPRPTPAPRPNPAPRPAQNRGGKSGGPVGNLGGHSGPVGGLGGQGGKPGGPGGKPGGNGGHGR